MAAVVMGYSPEPNHARAADDMSSPLPDRPIRPLPKRKLRERLSPEVASTIRYPPGPSISTPLFQYPHNTIKSEQQQSNRQADQPKNVQATGDRQRVDSAARTIRADESLRRNLSIKSKSGGADGAEEWRINGLQAGPSRGYAVRHSPVPNRNLRPSTSMLETWKDGDLELPASAASSVDGYESFENTNNKKKRKIPTPGDIGLNDIHLENDLATLEISEDCAGDKEFGTFGRGAIVSRKGYAAPTQRYGRSALVSPSTYSIRSSRSTPSKPSDTSIQGESAGIISTAIANAERSPTTPRRGQEHVSLLEGASRVTPSSTQFTFTCDSDVPSPVAWPVMDPSAGNNDMHSIGTDPMPQPQSARPPPPPEPSLPVNGKPPRKDRKRPTGNQYLIAAKHRREQQQFKNRQNPPGPGEYWMCEFCEYELIFGKPPFASVEQYERNEMESKKVDANRRRLLEKAKNRVKGKKSRGKTMPASLPTEQEHCLGQPVQPNTQEGDVQAGHEDNSRQVYDDSPPREPYHNMHDHGTVTFQGGTGSSEIPNS